MNKWLLICAGVLLAATSWAGDVPVRGMVTMVDLGSTTCIPCKMMEPVMKNLRAVYKDRAAIVFVDVDKSQSAARKFKLQVIPTQIFFDNKGGEKWRHVGFLKQEKCAAKLDELLGG